ncbi:MAG: hypothetical protein ACYSYT_04430 [Planctomycetota bacterium]|jgi:hypothetical protein
MVVTPIVTPIVTTWLSAILLGLTPIERWEAARGFSNDFMTERWFTITLVVIIITATILLFLVSYKRREQERRVTERLFSEYAERVGLSGRERQILLDIVGQAGLKRSEAIFTMGSAFDNGADRIIEKSFERSQTSGESKQLKAELSFLREKLGFKGRSGPGAVLKPKKLSSRQIPIGRKLHLTRRKTRISEDIEAVVVANNDEELTVEFAMAVKITLGEIWRVRYYFGASVWEFDSSVVSCNGNTIVLNHSDNVRFINRRRFLRVPVDKQAFIARFPFARVLEAEDTVAGEGSADGRALGVNSGAVWGPPEFVPAVVTELAGPGLRIEAQLEVKVGERVLVVSRLDEEVGPESNLQKADGPSTSKIIEDIGEVRHIEPAQNGFSIAVELIGLNDSDVSELIRATNAAFLKTSGEGRGTQGSANTEAGIAAPAGVQGERISE